MTKKTVVTAKNMNAILEHYKKEVERIKVILENKHKKELSAINGGLAILKFEHEKKDNLLVKLILLHYKATEYLFFRCIQIS